MPRLGLGMPIVSGVSNAPVTLIDDELFLNDVSGEVTTPFTGNRTNKILHSQDLKQSTWTKTNSAIASDLYEAPDNSTTANAIQNDATSDEERKVTATHAIVAGETYTLSGHFKKGLYNFVKLYHSDTAVAFSAFFNITTGAVSGASNTLSTSFDKMDDDWIRCSITFQATTTGNGGLILSAAPTSSSTSASIATGAGQELIYVWGMQLEEDSRMSAYIVTTNTAVSPAVTLNDTHDIWDFDVDGDGVKTNDITPEVDPDAEGVWEETTADLVADGDGSSTATWSTAYANTTLSTSGSTLRATANGSGAYGFSQRLTGLDTSSQYVIEATINVDNASGGTANFRLATNSNLSSDAVALSTATGTTTTILSPSAATMYIGIVDTAGSSSDYVEFSSISVKEYAITPLDV